MFHAQILTLFPEFFDSPLACSIPSRAISAGLLQVDCINIRDFSTDKHNRVDDKPYGGGPGMVMKPEPFFEAVDDLRRTDCESHVVLLSPQGETLNHQLARSLSHRDHLILLCARYEGIDERVRTSIVDEEISIGDYVLSGGEFPALVLLDCVGRLVDGVLGNEASAEQESHSQSLLEYPQYTRPAEYRGMSVPDELVDGHHEQVRLWRRKQALARTLKRRPELLARAPLSDEDWQLLGEL